MSQEPEPEKGGLELDIKWETVESEDAREVIERIQLVSERVLFHWRAFPIILPQSIVDNKQICLKDLFVLPTFDELDALTTDCKGNPKFLSHNQLQSIKRKGQFTVPSINFPGQTHVWKLNNFFQKGIDTAREEYLDGLSFSMRFLVVYAPELLLADRLSVKESLNYLKSDLVELFDLLFGVGKVYSPNLERRIQEERCKFLVAELKCKGEGAKQIGRYVRNQAQKALREKVTMAMERAPSIPYRFTTPISLEVDLRLFDRDVMRKVASPLTRILEKSGRGWFLSFREKVIAELKTRKLSEAEIEMEANIMVMDEYLKRVYNGVRSCPEITCTGQDVDRLLIEQAQLYVLMHRALDIVSIKMEMELRDIKKYFVGEYPILSRDSSWMKEQMDRAQKKFIEENKWLPHEISVELFKQHFLKQHTYFLSRDLAFMRDTEPVLRKELEADKKPCRSYEWKIRIWRPENYLITRVLHGQTEVIPTVISSVPTSITSPRSDPYHPIFSVKRVTTRVTTSRWPLWRVQNYIHRTLTWLLNTMFVLGYIVPWCSPLSVRALFCTRPFLSDYELSQVNGTLCPKKSSQRATLISRLIDIWRKVSKARTRFESQPDTGFLGKGWNRFLNRFWNYVVKGFFPSIFLVLFLPLGSLVTCILSLALCVTAPAWMPLVVLVFHLVCIIVYDFDCPTPDRNQIFPLFVTLGSLVLRGVVQPIFCLIGALVLCPTVSGLIALCSVFNYGVRIAWDSLMFYSLIKPKGRLPSGNSWIVKRVMGPGLAPDFYFEITIEQALIAFQAKLETEELNVYYHKANQKISEPLTEYKTFFQNCFSPFSAKLVESEGPYKDLIRETLVLKSSLEDKVLKRRQQLETGLNVSTRSRIRMRKPLLEKTLFAACKVAQNFYPVRIFSKMSGEEVTNFWESRGLDVGDWMNLAILLMSEIFCQDFLTPLDDPDVCFSVEMRMRENPISSDVLLTTIESECWGGEVPVTMSKVKYHIHSPFLDISAFNPMSRSPHIIEHTLSLYLCIPLPILHPAYISVIIHNRETDNPFSTDNAVCQAILKALQDSGPTLNQDCISLEIEDSTSSSSDDNSSLARSTPTQEDMLAVDSPTHLYGQVPTHPPSSRRGGGDTGSLTPDLGASSANTSGHGGHSSKASLACPEEINLEDVVLSSYGTTV
ncbi:hypothetical protein Ocin01_11990 [Orchesella cincta]|uniref:Uncharacterized protein n=1 Tax=Orchesella cincta TaxID=48709 RepID=A0A1D2MPI0_ORCCI|nr:hypothetical protein Ocin01_11990 [Orchesella cincta]